MNDRVVLHIEEGIADVRLKALLGKANHVEAVMTHLENRAPQWVSR
jgi:hypothetical protein